ncbi:MAG TPA: hypothetical protein VLF95_12495, partial [Vicinamibacteria bacterium]|nr:hypothetical protein [Vicinamibacteria bacterium]
MGPARLRRAASLPRRTFVLALALGVAPLHADEPATAVPDPAAATEAIAAGDAHYARRGEGADGDRALAFQIDGAIAEYRRALALDPGSLPARLRLMRAYFFRTGFCGEMPRDEKVRLLDEAKRIAGEAVSRLDAELARRKGSVAKDAGARVAPAAGAYLWAAISWGQWAVYHRVSAAWSGAPGRIRDLAEAVIAIDPATEQAGAYIILGRLHAEAPKVPFVTGWVSRDKAVRYVREGLGLAPDNRALVYYAADVLLRYARQSEGEARALLDRCATSPPRP